jgi:hypothetical protein
VLTVHNDALTFRFVLFDQPGLSHTGTASMGLDESLYQMGDGGSFLLKLGRRGIHLGTAEVIDL